MKTKLVVLIVLLVLSSCAKKGEPTVIEDTAQKVNDYADTLTGSIESAHNVVNELNARNAKVQEQIDTIGK